VLQLLEQAAEAAAVGLLVLVLQEDLEAAEMELLVDLVLEQEVMD